MINMALDESFFNSIEIELVKRKFYNANKVNELLDTIRRQALELSAENQRLKAELKVLSSQKAEIAEAVLSAQSLCRELTAKAKAEAEEIVSEAQRQRDSIINENLRQHEFAVETVENCFTSMRQRHLDAIEDLNSQWQEFLCGLYSEEEQFHALPGAAASLPSDLPEKLDDIAKHLEDISHIS